ncbi:diguanylate cyclase domain-containing protein [Shewanella psychrotolerans]|uniref:diguanylate cyclase domain-containing protein n=1 Tax=Shewanella psychrotolerans TaxID=2864206 RepID=UPI001C660357|nr:diguanylate cyclase [Shewanella psychrotolerans]QYK01622.1 diguanylate cyclase [Shewanella psychrotolerans]
MQILDNRTLLVVIALISIGSAVALISLWRAQNKRNGSGFWASGMSCIALASVLLFGRGSLPEFLSLVIANTFYVVGFLLIYRGIRIFTGREPLGLFDISFPLLMSLLFCYFYYIDNNLNIRIAVLSAAFFIICTMVVKTLLAEKDAPWRTAGYAVAFMFGLFGLSHGSRGIIALFSASYTGFLDPSVTSSIVLLSSVFIIGGIAISLVLLSYSVLEARLRIVSLAIEQSASSIVITDKVGAIKYVNPAFIDKTGYSSEELMGQNPRVLQSGEMDASEYSRLWQTISSGDTWRGEFHNRKKNGEFFWEIASIAPVKQRNGHISHFVAVKEDISALKEAKERIHHLANHDGLTGLPSRTFFMQSLSNVLRSEHAKNCAVLFVDLDGFKAINDSFGHDAGDQLLIEATRRLSCSVRDIDIVGRIGGDEFLILCTEVESQAAVKLVAEHIVNLLAQPFIYDDAEVTISASIGIAFYPQDSDDAETLVKMADKAMYQVKRQGKNNYAFAN